MHLATFRASSNKVSAPSKSKSLIMSMTRTAAFADVCLCCGAWVRVANRSLLFEGSILFCCPVRLFARDRHYLFDQSFRLHWFGQGLGFRIVDPYAHPVRDELEELENLRIFLFGKHVYLQIKMIATLGQAGFVILADE